MNKISERLQFLRLDLGISQAEIASKFGIPLSTYRKYEKGPSEPGSEAMAGISKAGINANWLLTGEGDMLIAPDEAHVIPVRKIEPAFTAKPLLTEESTGTYDVAEIDQYVDARGSAGPGAVASDEVVVKVRLDANLLRERVGCSLDRIKIATVSGDSMYPTLSHGDQVLIDTTCNSFVDDAIYAIQQDGFLRFKRIKKMLDGTIVVKSDNETLNAAETYTAEQAQYFKVVGQILPFKVGRFRI